MMKLSTLATLSLFFFSALVTDARGVQKRQNQRALPRRGGRGKRGFRSCLTDLIPDGSPRQHRPGGIFNPFSTSNCTQDVPCAYGRGLGDLNGTLVCRTMLGCRRNFTRTTCIPPEMSLDGVLVSDECGICPDSVLPPTCACSCTDGTNTGFLINVTRVRRNTTTFGCVPQDVAVTMQLYRPDSVSCVDTADSFCDTHTAADFDNRYFDRFGV